MRESLSRVMGTLYTLYGIVVPAFVALLTIYGKDVFLSNNQEIVGFVAVAIFAAGSIFANVLWVEAHKYLGYLYLELMPRMYSYAGMESEINFLQHVSKKNNFLRTFPHLIFNIASYITMLVVGIYFIGAKEYELNIESLALPIIASILFVCALITTIVAAVSSANLSNELSKSTISTKREDK